MAAQQRILPPSCRWPSTARFAQPTSRPSSSCLRVWPIARSDGRTASVLRIPEVVPASGVQAGRVGRPVVGAFGERGIASEPYAHAGASQLRRHDGGLGGGRYGDRWHQRCRMGERSPAATHWSPRPRSNPLPGGPCSRGPASTSATAARSPSSASAAAKSASSGSRFSRFPAESLWRAP